MTQQRGVVVPILTSQRVVYISLRMYALFVSLLNVNFDMCFAILTFFLNNIFALHWAPRFGLRAKLLSKPTAPPQVWSLILIAFKSYDLRPLTAVSEG